MSDEVRARMEARRKRILENAESRLRKITSVQNPLSPIPSEPTMPPVPSSVENPLPPIPSQPTLPSVPTSTPNPLPPAAPPLPTPSQDTLLSEDGDEEPPSLPLSPSPSDTQVDPLGFLQGLEEEKERASPSRSTNLRNPDLLSLVLFLTLSFIVRLSCQINASWIVNENVMAPFVGVAVVRLTTLWQCVDPPRGLVPTALLLTGISAHRLAFLLKALTLTRQFFKLFAFYLFGFVISDLIIEAVAS